MSQGKNQTKLESILNWIQKNISEMPLKPYKGRNVEYKIVLEKKRIPNFMISCSILAIEKEQIKSKISRWREASMIRAHIS